MMQSSPFKYLMYSLVVSSTMMILLSPNWVAAWIMLEINMLSFLPIICDLKSNQETEAAVKYFLVQALGSLMLLTSSAMIYQTKMQLVMLLLMLSAMLMKLGAFPCHFWYPSVMSSMSWSNCLILSTWQKIAPLVLMSMMVTNSLMYMIMLLASMNTLLGGVLGMNQSNLRALLAYSSIGHLGWVLSMVAMNKMMAWMLYFFMYCIVVTPVFFLMILTNSKTVQDLYKLSKMSMIIPMIMSLLMLSMAGMPPLVGFVPKLIVMKYLMETNYIFMLMLLMGSYMNLYYYMIISLSAIMTPNQPFMMKKFSNKMKYLSVAAMLSLTLLGIMILII